MPVGKPNGVPLLCVLPRHACLIWVVYSMSGCDTQDLAIALDGAFPAGRAGRAAGQRLGVFGRRPEGLGAAPVSLTDTYDSRPTELGSEPAEAQAAQGNRAASL